jgi:hypothetical protein
MPEPNEMKHATQNGNAPEKGGGSVDTAHLNALTDIKSDLPKSLLDDPHDGRVHSGLSGDDGQHQPVDGPAVPASLQPGHASDLGATHERPADAEMSPAEAYANTGQAATEPGLREPGDTGDDNDVDANYPSTKKHRGKIDPLARGSGVGRQRRAESDLEQPRGDGSYQKDGDREIPIDAGPDAGDE